MFEYLKGILAEKYSNNNGYYFIVEVAGIGYSVEVSELDFNTYVNPLDIEIKEFFDNIKFVASKNSEVYHKTPRILHDLPNM